MKIAATVARTFLVAMGYAMAKDWPANRMEKKMRNVPKVVKEEKRVIPDEHKTMFAELEAALEKNEAISIDSGDEVPTEKKEKAAKGEKKEKAAKAPKEPKPPKEPKGPGIIDTILEVVQGGSATNPVTKADVMKKLEERFKDRKADAMIKTVNIQLPSRLNKTKAEGGRSAGIKKNEKGYYIPKK